MRKDNYIITHYQSQFITALRVKTNFMSSHFVFPSLCISSCMGWGSESERGAFDPLFNSTRFVLALLAHILPGLCPASPPRLPTTPLRRILLKRQAPAHLREWISCPWDVLCMLIHFSNRQRNRGRPFVCQKFREKQENAYVRQQHSLAADRTEKAKAPLGGQDWSYSPPVGYSAAHILCPFTSLPVKAMWHT